MAEKGSRGGGFSMPSAGLLALTIAVFGLILAGPAPFIDERPASQQSGDADEGKVQDVDARMWQDPLGAVLKVMPGEDKDDDTLREAHSLDNTVNRAFGHARPKIRNILVLGVLIPGGPYPEEEERRRRRRYAVLSALATQGYAPQETEHLGYFLAHAGNGMDCKKTCSGRDDFPVPFELFSGDTSKTTGRGVIVLWLDNGQFEHNVQQMIGNVLHPIAPHGVQAAIARMVIGPNTSSLLKTMVQEAAPPDPGITFYSAGATLDDDLLGGPLPANVMRTIPTDRIIAKSLVSELELRHIRPGKDHVLLVSEWDSLYGRSLPETFARAMLNRTAHGTGGAPKNGLCQPLEATHGVSATRVYCVNYMRGIDGLLPMTGKESASVPESRPAAPFKSNNNIDRPSGNNQEDYLRRLVDQIRRVDNQIADAEPHSPFKNSGIAAIGVLGSDVYDKLMILQALRPYFPGKIFFTTDLDAEFFTPREQPYTHNLIVGSSYGLRLAPVLQQAIPPFRDSYQTATFLTVKLATARWNRSGTDLRKPESKLRHLARRARVFEIGRQGAVRLPLPDEHASASHTHPCANARDILSCTSVLPAHGAGDRTHLAPYGFALRAAVLALALMLLYGMSWRSRRLFASADTWLRAHLKVDLLAETVAMLPIVAAGLVIAGLLYLLLTGVFRDEPFYWMNGISIWPSTLLQLAALLLALGFLYWIKALLRRAMDQMEHRFRLDCPSESGAAAAPRPLDPLALHKWILPGEKQDERPIDVGQLWSEYRVYENHGPARTAIGTVIFALFGLAAIMLSGGLPAPARGAALYVDMVVETSAALGVIFLIMRVVDSARLAARFIELISANRETRWPCVKDPDWGWPGASEAALADWIDVQFVAKYTRAIEKFIWFPIPSMLLLGIARSSIFDNWTFSTGLFVAIAVLLGHLFSTAYLLQRGARRMREKSLDRLASIVSAMRGKPDATEDSIHQIEKMIAEIKENQEGAFMPFMRQPMVQALLTLLSGLGGMIVLLQRAFF